MAKRGRKPKKEKQAESSKGATKVIFGILCLLFAGISFLSIFGGISDAQHTSVLSEFLTEKFGSTSFFVPIIVLYLGLLSLSFLKLPFINSKVFIGLSLMFVSLMGIFGISGGITGLALRELVAAYATEVGSIFIYFLVFVVSVLLVINMSASEFFENLTKLFGIFTLNVRELFADKKLVDRPLENARPDNLYDSKDNSEEGKTLILPEGLSGAESYSINNANEPDTSTFSAVTVDYVSPSAEVLEKLEKSRFEVITPPDQPVSEIKSGKKAMLDSAKVYITQKTRPLSNTKENLLGDDTMGKIKEGKHGKPKLPFSNKLWEYPPFTLLDNTPDRPADAGNIQERAAIIENTLKAFGIKANISNVSIGPAVTQYALDLAVGTKASKIQTISTDLALRLKSPSGSVRVVAPIPGTNLVGIEVPNYTPSSVALRTVLASDDFKKAKGKLKVALGKDVGGKVVVQDIAKWPHALVAGSTGSGKSVMLNAIISSLLFNCSPAECRMIMIDPKFVELSQYNGIPHLLTPVVTEIEQKAVSTFAWAVDEMERRYKVFASAGARNIESYNSMSGFQALPYIVLIVDELADMMMVAASEVEKYIIRLAQKSRATGIHLILATQRPSVNVITGTIKANIPTRIAFKVTSNTDSRVILDQSGAETLVGRGDMLFVPPDDSKPHRIQGVFVADREIQGLVQYFKDNDIEPEYHEEILEHKHANASSSGSGTGGMAGDIDDKFKEAIDIVCTEGKASASYLQRKLQLGYSRAARMIDDMEAMGIIGSARGSKPREVLVASVEEALSKLK